MRIRPLVFFIFLCMGGVATITSLWAAPNFPALTGRVVDDAHILSANTRQSLGQTLADYEAGTTNQVVVVTLPSLQGDSIEDYGYQLGRHWQIGQKGKNNGVLLIVAPNEHKVRIEVGYGLEPTLTDAASSEIVHGIILPDFRSGHTEQGVIDGTQAILSVLGGKGVPTHYAQQNQMSPGEAWIILAFLVWFWLMRILDWRHPLIASALLAGQATRFGSSGLNNSGWGSGGFGGGFSGFSGGGGSFGGGGASGGW